MLDATFVRSKCTSDLSTFIDRTGLSGCLEGHPKLSMWYGQPHWACTSQNPRTTASYIHHLTFKRRQWKYVSIPHHPRRVPLMQSSDYKLTQGIITSCTWQLSLTSTFWTFCSSWAIILETNKT